MCIERYVRLVAGVMIALSLILAQTVSHYFLYLTAFVGLNLFQAAFTNWCPLISILRHFGVRDCGLPTSEQRV